MSGGEGLHLSLNTFVSFYSDILTSRKQRTKISNTYSSWQVILSFNTWTIIIQHWRMRLIFHHRGLWYYKPCRWQYPTFKQEKSWGSFERFRECVVKPVSMVYRKQIERKCKQMSFTDKFWWKCACKCRYITN